MIKNLGTYIIVIFIVSFVLSAFQITIGITPSEQRGKLIYTKGMRASGEAINAQLSGAQFDAKILPCSNCHGSTGKGNPEGGADPSPLDWSSLTKSYFVEFKNGRKRVGYNHISLKRAIVEGIDPSENELDLLMPRYSLNDEDVKDLISYLKIIDKLEVQGITDSSIQVGVILSKMDRHSKRSEIMVKTMKAYLDQVNSGGGLYNRKLYLREVYTEDSPEKTDSIVLNFIDEQNVFAFIATDLEALSPVSLAALEKSKIPVIGAISGNPKREDYMENSFYYLFPGLNQEINSLANFALNDLETEIDNFVILYDSTASRPRVELEHILSNKSLRIVDLNNDDPELLVKLEQLKNEGIQSCLYIGDTNESLSFLLSTQKLNWYPNILLSGKYASPTWLDAPIEMNEKIYFSYPTWISERNEKAMHQYNLMATSYNLNDEYINSQLNGLASTILFTEVMKLTEKNISQESFIETLQGVQDFESGFVSPLTFGPNKRIGSEKVFIVVANVKTKRLRLVN